MVSHTNKVGRREREAQTTQNQSAEEKWYSGSWKIRHLHRNRLVTSTGCSTFGKLRPKRNASCANCCSQSYQIMRRRWLIVVGVYEEEMRRKLKPSPTCQQQQQQTSRMEHQLHGSAKKPSASPQLDVVSGSWATCPPNLQKTGRNHADWNSGTLGIRCKKMY